MKPARLRKAKMEPDPALGLNDPDLHPIALRALQQRAEAEQARDAAADAEESPTA